MNVQIGPLPSALDPNAASLGQDADWGGNNAAFTCPVCKKVFIVSAQLHNGSRECLLRVSQIRGINLGHYPLGLLFAYFGIED